MIDDYEHLGAGAMAALRAAPRTFLEWCGHGAAYLVVLATIVGFAYGLMFGGPIVAALAGVGAQQPVASDFNTPQQEHLEKEMDSNYKEIERNQQLIDQLYAQEAATLKARAAEAP